jgi:hypothetical protein
LWLVSEDLAKYVVVRVVRGLEALYTSMYYLI